MLILAMAVGVSPPMSKELPVFPPEPLPIINLPPYYGLDNDRVCFPFIS